jgi:hypothetical protein
MEYHLDLYHRQIVQRAPPGFQKGEYWCLYLPQVKLHPSLAVVLGTSVRFRTEICQSLINDFPLPFPLPLNPFFSVNRNKELNYTKYLSFFSLTCHDEFII